MSHKKPFCKILIFNRQTEREDSGGWLLCNACTFEISQNLNIALKHNPCFHPCEKRLQNGIECMGADQFTAQYWHPKSKNYWSCHSNEAFLSDTNNAGWQAVH